VATGCHIRCLLEALETHANNANRTAQPLQTIRETRRGKKKFIKRINKNDNDEEEEDIGLLVNQQCCIN
jgi:hypothetical protein